MDMQVMYCANGTGGVPSAPAGGASTAYYRLMLNGYGVYQPSPTSAATVGSAMDMLPCLPNMDLSYLVS